MDLRFDETNNQVFIGHLSNEDLQHSVWIRETINTKGWNVLMKYWTFAMQEMIKSGIRSSKNVDDAPLAPYKWARLDGFKQAMDIPERILTRAEEVVQSKKESDANVE